MPYKFKNNGPQFITGKSKIIYLGLIAVGYLLVYLSYLNNKTLLFTDYFYIISTGLIIYGIQFNGIYKALRWYAEWKIKRFDNKWR